MKRKRVVYFILFILIVSMLSNMVLAEDDDEVEESGGLFSLLKVLWKGFEKFLNKSFDTALNPPIANSKGFPSLWNFVYALSFSLLLIIFIYTGYMFMIASGEPAKVELAKQQLRNIFFMLVFITASPLIIGFIVDLITAVGEVITNLFVETTSIITGILNTLGTAGLIIYLGGALVILILGFMFLIACGVRYLVTLLLLSIFPLIIMLYFFQPTHELGKKLFKMLLMHLLVPLVWMLVFAIALSVTHIPVFGGLVVIASFYVNVKIYGWMTNVASVTRPAIKEGASIVRKIKMIRSGTPPI